MRFRDFNRVWRDQTFETKPLLYSGLGGVFPTVQIEFGAQLVFDTVEYGGFVEGGQDAGDDGFGSIIAPGSTVGEIGFSDLPDRIR